jgi:hypothetical protein
MAGRKNGKLGFTTSQLFNFTRDSYLERTSRPMYAIAFLLPFILFYEIGTVLINTDVLNRTQVRVVAFVWLQDFLLYLGTGDKLAWIAPPLVVMVILLGLQVAAHKPWWFCFSDYLPMVVECILLAIPLIVLSLFFNSPVSGPPGGAQLPPPPVVGSYAAAPEQAAIVGERLLLLAQSAGGEMTGRSLMADIVTGVGAGIYEELVFRLILICALMVLFQDVIGIDHKNGVILSVLISAALFSAHHHIVYVNGRFSHGDPFTWIVYVFRTSAGVYFAALFAIRGFGIAAGTHAVYNIIAAILDVLFFHP